MNFRDYQELAGVTAGDHGDTVRELTNWAMGLAGETGELVDLLKKEIFQGVIASKKDFESEAGDVLWYLANLCRTRGVDLERVAVNNLEKLRARYPKGFVKGGGIREINVAPSPEAGSKVLDLSADKAVLKAIEKHGDALRNLGPE